MNVKKNLIFLKEWDAMNKLIKKNKSRNMVSIRIQPILLPIPLKIEINSLLKIESSNLLPVLLQPSIITEINQEEDYFKIMKISNDKKEEFKKN